MFCWHRSVLVTQTSGCGCVTLVQHAVAGRMMNCRGTRKAQPQGECSHRPHPSPYLAFQSGGNRQLAPPYRRYDAVNKDNRWELTVPLHCHSKYKLFITITPALTRWGLKAKHLSTEANSKPLPQHPGPPRDPGNKHRPTDAVMQHFLEGGPAPVGHYEPLAAPGAAVDFGWASTVSVGI